MLAAQSFFFYSSINSILYCMGICLEYCEPFQMKTSDFYAKNFDWRVYVFCTNVTHRYVKSIQFIKYVNKCQTNKRWNVLNLKLEDEMKYKLWENRMTKK